MPGLLERKEIDTRKETESKETQNTDGNNLAVKYSLRQAAIIVKCFRIQVRKKEQVCSVCTNSNSTRWILRFSSAFLVIPKIP